MTALWLEDPAASLCFPPFHKRAKIVAIMVFHRRTCKHAQPRTFCDQYRYHYPDDINAHRCEYIIFVHQHGERLRAVLPKSDYWAALLSSALSYVMNVLVKILVGAGLTLSRCVALQDLLNAWRLSIWHAMYDYPTKAKTLPISSRCSKTGKLETHDSSICHYEHHQLASTPGS